MMFHFLVAFGLLVVFCPHNLGEFDVEGVPDVVDADVGGQATEVDERGLCVGDGFLRKGADVGIHVLNLTQQFESQGAGKLPGNSHGTGRVEVGKVGLMASIDSVAYVGNALQDVQVAPFLHICLALAPTRLLPRHLRL